MTKIRSFPMIALAAVFLAALLGGRVRALELKFQTDRPVLLQRVQFSPGAPRKTSGTWEVVLVNETHQSITVKAQPNSAGEWVTLTAGPNGGKASAPTRATELNTMDLQVLPAPGAPKHLDVNVNRDTDTKTLTLTISITGTPI